MDKAVHGCLAAAVIAVDAQGRIAVFNAAAALLVAGRAKTLKEGAAQAAAALDSGKAKATLAKLVEASNRG